MQSLTNQPKSGEEPEIIKLSSKDDKLSSKDDKLSSKDNKLSSKDDKLSVLTEEEIEVISNSISEFNNSDRILAPVQYPQFYFIQLYNDGTFVVCIDFFDPISGTVSRYHDTEIITEFNKNVIKLYKYFSKEEIGEQIFYYIFSNNIPRPGKLTGMLLEMNSHELSLLMKNQDELDKKIQEAIDVLMKYQNDLDTKIEETIDISKESKFLEREFPSLALLLTIFAHFKKSLAVIFYDKKDPLKINAIFNRKIYDEIINRIIEFVRNILRDTTDIPDYNDDIIRNFFVALSQREIKIPAETYRNSDSRNIEDFIVLSTIFGCKQIVSRPKKPNSEDFFSIRELSEDANKEIRLEYQNSLLDNILNDSSIKKKVKIFMFLWNETNGLENFVNEVSSYPK
jgi:hypothetical protein